MDWFPFIRFIQFPFPDKKIKENTFISNKCFCFGQGFPIPAREWKKTITWQTLKTFNNEYKVLNEGKYRIK